MAAAFSIAGGVATRMAYERSVRIAAALPAMPDLQGKPAQFADLLTRANALARSSRHRWEGVAELGRLYHANGYRAEAAACWRLLRTEQPGVARWPYYLASLRRIASDYPEMTALLRETVKSAPHYAPAWLQLAEQELKTGNADAAERDYRTRLKLMPGDAYARLGLARLAQRAGRHMEARGAIEELVRDVPEFPSSHNLYAEMLSADGDEPGAERERQRARAAGRFREADDPWLAELNAWCYDPKQLFVLATIEYQTNEGDRGLGYLERAVQVQPNDPTGYEMLGDLQLKLGNAAAARKALEQALALSSAVRPSPAIFGGLSQAYRALSQPEEALKAAQHGLAKSGETPELYNACGAALADMGRHEDAIAAYRKAIAINPNDTEANFNLGASLLTLGRTKEAVAHLHQALVLQPQFPQALALLGRLEMDSGRLKEAAKYFRPLLESNPTLPQARKLMSIWHLHVGRSAEQDNDTANAERHYREGLALDPNEPELNTSLGTLYLIQHRFADALTPLEALYRARPDDPQSALFLGQVYAALGRIDDARRMLSAGADLADRAGRKDTASHCREILRQL